MVAGGSWRDLVVGRTRWLPAMLAAVTLAMAASPPASATSGAAADPPATAEAPACAGSAPAGRPPETTVSPAAASRAAPTTVWVRLALHAEGRSAAPGGWIPGSVTMLGAPGPPHTVRLVVQDAGPGTRITVSPPKPVLSDTDSTRFDFRLYFAPNTILGANSATLLVTDAVDPSVVYDDQRLLAWVERPSAPLDPLRWQWVAVAALLAVVVVALLALAAGSDRATRRRG
jgi:hypothetical protein